MSRARTGDVGKHELLALLDVFHVGAQRLELRLELRRRVGRVVLERLVPGVAHLALVHVVHELEHDVSRLVRREDLLRVRLTGRQVQARHVDLDDELLSGGGAVEHQRVTVHLDVRGQRHAVAGDGSTGVLGRAGGSAARRGRPARRREAKRRASSWRLRARRLPAHPFAERGDVRHVMAAVPRVHREQLVERHHTQLGVAKLPGELSGGEQSEHQHPPLV